MGWSAILKKKKEAVFKGGGTLSYYFLSSSMAPNKLPCEKQKRWINKELSLGKEKKSISLEQIGCHWIIPHKAGFVPMCAYTGRVLGDFMRMCV